MLLKWLPCMINTIYIKKQFWCVFFWHVKNLIVLLLNSPQSLDNRNKDNIVKGKKIFSKAAVMMPTFSVVKIASVNGDAVYFLFLLTWKSVYTYVMVALLKQHKLWDAVSFRCLFLHLFESFTVHYILKKNLHQTHFDTTLTCYTENVAWYSGCASQQSGRAQRGIVV